MTDWNVFARGVVPPPAAEDRFAAAERRAELKAALGGAAQREQLRRLLRDEEGRAVYAAGVTADHLAYHEGRKDVLRQLLRDLSHYETEQ
jgi:hypothetical protein